MLVAFVLGFAVVALLFLCAWGLTEVSFVVGKCLMWLFGQGYELPPVWLGLGIYIVLTSALIIWLSIASQKYRKKKG